MCVFVVYRGKLVIKGCNESLGFGSCAFRAPVTPIELSGYQGCFIVVLSLFLYLWICV